MAFSWISYSHAAAVFRCTGLQQFAKRGSSHVKPCSGGTYLGYVMRIRSCNQLEAAGTIPFYGLNGIHTL